MAEDSLAIVPMPVRLEALGGDVTLESPYTIHHGNHPEAEATAHLIATVLNDEVYSPRVQAGDGTGGIRVELADLSWAAEISDGIVEEAYELRVNTEGVTLMAATPAGLRMGVATIRQLLHSSTTPEGAIRMPHLRICDWPRFSWRGIHLDVSRHFFDVDTVKRFIDLAALHHLNTFHWHLTDDQGWRLPIEGYPKLTEIAAWRDWTLTGHERDRPRRYKQVRHGGFYTHEQIRDVVKYAEVRGVRIVPEIDVPGHVQALLTAYPEFGCTGYAPGMRPHWGISPHVLNLEPETLRFLDATVDTICELFPFPFAHFGGDEAPTGQWGDSPQVQSRMAEHGISSDAGVQAWVLERLRNRLANHGRRLIGWDEILDVGSISTDTVVMFWRDGEPRHVRALEKGHQVVLAPNHYTYLDACQSETEDGNAEPLSIGGHLPLEKVYAWEPLADVPSEKRRAVLGGQAQLWSEYIPTQDHLDYMTYPRACALAEVLWHGTAPQSYSDFQLKLNLHVKRLAGLGVKGRFSPYNL